MTLDFLPQNQRQRYLLLTLGIVALGAMGVFWYQFMREEPLSQPRLQPPPRDVQIDFTVFEHPVFVELGEPKAPIPILSPDEVGKTNPFVQ